jgi:6-pyruvoyltetrahydropterin/6-carboxytetrahydropterin synthase
MMFIKKMFRFEAGHRLPKHGGRCAGIHGHSYKVEFCLTSDPDFSTGMVMDFGDVKEKIGWLVDQFDHSLIVSRNDSLAASLSGIEALEQMNPRYVIMPCEPTAEMMAAYFYWWTVAIFGGLTTKSVTVWETETSSSTCDRILREVNFAETIYSEAVRAATR